MCGDTVTTVTDHEYYPVLCVHRLYTDCVSQDGSTWAHLGYLNIHVTHLLVVHIHEWVYYDLVALVVSFLPVVVVFLVVDSCSLQRERLFLAFVFN